MTHLQDAHVLVVGGTEGIGWNIADQAFRKGARVSIIARRQERLDEVWAGFVDQSVSGVGGPSPVRVVHTRPADANNFEALKYAVERLEQANGPVDVAVSCVGGALPGYFDDIDPDEFRSQMGINFFSAVNVAKVVVPGMRARRHGHLVLTSSTAALVGVIGYTSYAPAKAAIKSFADCLRYETEPDGVLVSVAFPPDTLTPGFDAENERKPAETVAVSGGIKPKDPGVVAERIISGIVKGRRNITADGQTKALALVGGLVEPAVRRTMRRQIVGVQKGSS